MIPASEIKFIRSLSQKKFRDSSSLFVVEGEKLVAEALASGFTVRSVWRKDEIGEKAMERISSLNSPPPVLAVVEMPESKEIPLVDGGLYLALDSIRDPGNLGTILRTADWFSLDGVFASPDTVELYNPKVVQSTMGAIFRIPFQYTDIPTLCRRAAGKGIPVFGTFLEGEDIYRSSLGGGSGIIVIGNEANGISPETEATVSQRITIPRTRPGQGPESLNAAIATAITVAEFRSRKI